MYTRVEDVGYALLQTSVAHLNIDSNKSVRTRTVTESRWICLPV